jgi:hypothetical protein
MTSTVDSVDAPRKPTGGFIFLSVTQLCLVWWAYLEKLIELRDVRTWFGTWELQARRCLLKPGQQAIYTIEELSSLVGGVGGMHLRASIRRLEAVGLLLWSTSHLSFPKSPEELTVKDTSRLFDMLDAVPNNRRRVPVPRRMVRFLAGARRRCLMATILGHLIRCLYYRNGECSAKGCCTSSWIAKVFGVNGSNVKAARRYLAEMGWLTPLETSQHVRNRYGQWVMINLDWPGSDTHELPIVSPYLIPESPKPKLRPPALLSTTESRPPIINKKPFQEHKHQKPASGGQAGVWKEHEKTDTPTIEHIVPEDLRDTGRLLSLFEDAQRDGCIGGSESDRLTFIASAEHARFVGSRNPCGLFAQLIRRRLWHFVTADDEEAAGKRLKAHFYGGQEEKRPQVRAPAVLSDDGSFVAVLQSRMKQQGFHGDVFSLLHAERPEWTRERWESAVLELKERQHRACGHDLTSAADVAADVLLSGRLPELSETLGQNSPCEVKRSSVGGMCRL